MQLPPALPLSLFAHIDLGIVGTINNKQVHAEVAEVIIIEVSNRLKTFDVLILK